MVMCMSLAGSYVTLGHNIWCDKAVAVEYDSILGISYLLFPLH